MAKCLDQLLERFVKIHEGMKQRDSSWYTSMGHTIGGSEVATLLGCNPYANTHDVILSKVSLLKGIDTWGGGGAACWWGVVFEDIIAAYTAIDLGGTVRGDEICVQRFPGHRNSPDGYIVAHSALISAVKAHAKLTHCKHCCNACACGICDFVEATEANLQADLQADLPANLQATESETDEADPYCLWTTDMCPSLAILPRIFVLEFKCPLSRRLTGKVPAQYRPQVWSGLSVSPVAHAGLFVDAMFRKCAIADLGPNSEYDREYHKPTAKERDAAQLALSKETEANFDKSKFAEADLEAPKEAPKEATKEAHAWGLIGIYAPKLDAPAWVRIDRRNTEEGETKDAATTAWRIQVEAASAGAVIDESLILEPIPKSKPLIDFGRCPPHLFDRMLGLVNNRRFSCQRLPPCLADGRGLQLHAAENIAIEIDGLKQTAPNHFVLLGVLPWKLFEVVYVPVARHPGFMEEVLPLIADVHKKVTHAMTMADPFAYLRTERRADIYKAKSEASQKRGISKEELQDLFDYGAEAASVATPSVAAPSVAAPSEPAPANQ